MNEELRKLYALLDRVSDLILGSDPQMRREYMHVKNQTIKKIKSIEADMIEKSKALRLNSPIKSGKIDQ